MKGPKQTTELRFGKAQRWRKKLIITVHIAHTSHSLWPWKLSGLRLFIATTIPVPGLVGAKVFPSIHPLKTHPNPPSPSKLSERKFLVAFLRSLKLKDLRLLVRDDASPLDVIEDGFKLPKVACSLEAVESWFALQSGFVLPEGGQENTS